jgi:NTE family protein
MQMKRNKVAIACQGGGSQTAFTAGVLKALFENDIHQEKQIVAFSGTSGGAVCAALAWYSLVKAAKGDRTPIARRLVQFWQDNSTRNFFDKLLNDTLVFNLRLIDGGFLPRWELSPSSVYSRLALSYVSEMTCNRPFYDFKGLLEAHLDFAEIASWGKVDSPVLLVGAANVLKGEFKKFSSVQGEIRVEALLASAAVPSLFPAVQIGEDVYWDGLFSDNPPTDELLDEELVGPGNLPDELWIIQINPQRCKRIPTSSQDIVDRRNEMIGNQSLYQDLEKIRLINRLLEKGAFTEKFRAKYRPVQLRIIEMSPELQQMLDYSAKLDRDRAFIERLIQDGEIQGRKFIRMLR